MSDYDTDEALDQFETYFNDELTESLDAICTDYVDDTVPSSFEDRPESPLESLLTQMIEEYNKGDGKLYVAYSEFKGVVNSALSKLIKDIRPILEEHAKTLESDESDED